MTKERVDGTTTTQTSNTIKFIALFLIILAGWLGNSYITRVVDAESKIFKISSPDGKHNITLSRESNPDGVVFLDNNGKVHYISKEGNLYSMELTVKDELIKPIKPETKIGQTPDGH